MSSVTTIIPVVKIFEDGGGPGVRASVDIDEAAAAIGVTVQVKINVAETAGGDGDGSNSTPGGGTTQPGGDTTTNPDPGVTTLLSPYDGAWDDQAARHMLVRSSFAPTLAEIKAATSGTFDERVNYMVNTVSVVGDPLIHYDDGSMLLPVGATWVYQNADFAGRGTSLEAWRFEDHVYPAGILQDRMADFWRNHFAVSGTTEHRMAWQYLKYLKVNALGNFRTLMEDMTIMPAMLQRLNGDQNTADNPNENFARELIELFTVGKKATGIEGDFGYYYESDVRALSLPLSGWRRRAPVTGAHNHTTEAYFTASRHHDAPVTLSERFNNAVIEDTGDQTYKRVVEVALAHPHTSVYIVEKLYTFFVGSDFDDPTIQAEVIAPLAALLVSSDWELRPVMTKLLKSRAFMRDEVRGTMVKAPFDYVPSGIRPMGGYDRTGLSLRDDYEVNRQLGVQAEATGQDGDGPEQIAGWDAYRVAPDYYQYWLNGYLAKRVTNALGQFDIDGKTFFANSIKHVPDYRTFMSTLTAPTDIDQVIADIALIFLSGPQSAGTLLLLKETLLGELPDFEWAVEYNNYVNNPDDTTIDRGMTDRLKDLFEVLLQLEAFQLH